VLAIEALSLEGQQTLAVVDGHATTLSGEATGSIPRLSITLRHSQRSFVLEEALVGALDHLSCWLNPVCQLWQAVKLL